jgi:hypothetical protein
MNLALISLAVGTALLAHLKLIPAGAFLIFASVALAYLGAYYIKIDGSKESTYARDKTLGFAFILTSLGTMMYAIGDFSPDGKLKTQVYHIFIVPILLGSFFAGRFLGLQKISLTKFMHHAAATSFCLYLALKDAALGWPNGLLLVALFAWLTIQTIYRRRGSV